MDKETAIELYDAGCLNLDDYLALLATIEKLKAENERLKASEKRVGELEARLHGVKEVYAGMEGFEPETAPEAYCLRIIEQMYKAALGGDDVWHVEAVENGFIVTHSRSYKKRIFVDYDELLKWIANETAGGE